MSNLIVNALDMNGWIMYNKRIAQITSPYAAIILGCLCNRYSEAKENGYLYDDNSFITTREVIENDTLLSSNIQRTALKLLEDSHIITSYRSGIPAKTHYIINSDRLYELLADCTEDM